MRKIRYIFFNCHSGKKIKEEKKNTSQYLHIEGFRVFLKNKHFVSYFSMVFDIFSMYKLGSKVSFFWDRSQDMNLSSFPPKNRASDWLT